MVESKKRNVYMRVLIWLLIIVFYSLPSFSQDSYWQQNIKYDMNIDFDHKSHQFDIHQEITYTNNSPDELSKVYMHLYYNAFQPGSMMDVRSRSIADPDSRVVDRIYNLDKNEIGFQKIISVKNGSNNLTYFQEGTILEIFLNKSIKPGKKLNLSIDCKSQIPIQIRRTGRYNKEDVAYSMTQWYPKMCEYDLEGWHTNPYIGREFYGVWGDFNVKINIDSSFVLGGTGILQNPNEIGHGYETKKIERKGNSNKLKWHFKAENVHDFAWARSFFFTNKLN